MNNLKTIGELRQFIKDNGGVFIVGKLQFEHEEGKDIDIKLDGNLLTWFGSSIENETLLTDAYSTISSDIENGKTALREKRELEKKIEEMEMEMIKAKQEGVNNIKVAERLTTEAQTAIGKVEAYEKLLIGRDITISK